MVHLNAIAKRYTGLKDNIPETSRACTGPRLESERQYVAWPSDELTATTPTSRPGVLARSMLKWLKPLLFVIWGGLLIPLVGTAVEKWLAENLFSEPNAVMTAISSDLIAMRELRWFNFALVLMTGIVIGISLESSARRSGERKAFEMRSLGYKFRSLSETIKTRTVSPPWPDNARDLRPAIASALISARKFKLWTPNERVYELPDASFLCEYFSCVGKLLEDGHLQDAIREALSWKPFLDRAKPS